jgi:PAS domain-containing protein
MTEEHQMHDPSKTNQELIEENALLKQRIKELELSELALKRAEEELRQSEERYRTILDEIEDG